MLEPQLALGKPPKSMNDAPPLLGKPNPVSSSLLLGEPQGAKKTSAIVPGFDHVGAGRRYRNLRLPLYAYSGGRDVFCGGGGIHIETEVEGAGIGFGGRAGSETGTSKRSCGVRRLGTEAKHP